jgi:hypothetical protein
MKQATIAGLLMLYVACDANPRPATGQDHVRAADTFNEKAKSELAPWRFHAWAAGSDCSVLYVETPVALEESLIEGVHYGATSSRFCDGGVQRFAYDRRFRGTVYKDRAGRLFTFGDVTEAEAATFRKCR